MGSLPFHNSEVGLAYTAINLTASGGTPPYNWAVAAGTYPPGLVLASDGTVSGTSTTSGNFGFTVSVTDAQGQSVSGAGAITVFAQMTTTQPCATRCVIGVGCQRCGGFATVGRGAAPYSYRIVGGAVPNGMTWNALSVGGPFPAGSYSLSVQITDAVGGQTTVNANWSIYGPATLVAGPDCINSGNPPQCATRWTYSGGHPTVAPKLVILGYSQYCPVGVGCQYPTPTAPPPGWTVSVKGGVITMSAGGIPCNANPSTYAGVLTLALVDTTTCATTAQSNQGKLTVFIQNNC
jgi:putative Ig domain-containing protein